MSILIMSRVWANSASTGSARLVLLAIADFADDNGRAYPAVETLAEKARISERTAHYALKELVELGELSIAVAEGPRGCNLYRVQNLQGAKNDTKGVQNTTEGGAMTCTRTVIEPSIEPSKKPAPDGAVVSLPFTSEQFAKAWSEWQAYRRERRLPKLKPSSVRKQFRALGEWGEEAAIASIDRSIAQGWQGLFPPSPQQIKPAGTPVSGIMVPITRDTY